MNGMEQVLDTRCGRRNSSFLVRYYENNGTSQFTGVVSTSVALLAFFLWMKSAAAFCACYYQYSIFPVMYGRGVECS